MQHIHRRLGFGNPCLDVALNILPVSNDVNIIPVEVFLGARSSAVPYHLVQFGMRHVQSKFFALDVVCKDAVRLVNPISDISTCRVHLP